jgi:hypothetical protein
MKKLSLNRRSTIETNFKEFSTKKKYPEKFDKTLIEKVVLPQEDFKKVTVFFC